MVVKIGLVKSKIYFDKKKMGTKTNYPKMKASFILYDEKEKMFKKANRIS